MRQIRRCSSSTSWDTARVRGFIKQQKKADIYKEMKENKDRRDGTTTIDE